MGLIRILSDVVANKIAAGEVVERPVSVAKELLENSLDAGAKKLHIKVEQGGKRLIQVRDNGCGMSQDDAILAFERHATSKLMEVKDLESIATLGFRGEAIPAIASVSRFTLETKNVGDLTGTRIEVAGGKNPDISETALPDGTTITVRDLFYNVPARRKFLRTEKTELAHIAKLVTHYSLAHLDKSFHFVHEKGSSFNVAPVNDLHERVFQVFGAEILQQLVDLSTVTLELPSMLSQGSQVNDSIATSPTKFQDKRHTLKLTGFVSKPEVQKLNRNSIYTFVNHRLIRDRLLLHAISSAYHNIIPPGTLPFTLLFLEITCADVDVNVHPSKTEVRFRHQSIVHDFVRDSIRQCLVKSKPISTFSLAPESPLSPSTYGASLTPAEHSKTAKPPDSELDPSIGHTGRFDFKITPSIASSLENPSTPSSTQKADIDADLGDDLHVRSETHSHSPLRETRSESMAILSNLHPLGQIRKSFIVAAGIDGLWIIDQHVAHERILFEKILDERSQGATQTQRLLMPIIITLRADQQVKFQQIEREFRSSGFDLEPFGNRTIAVKAAPATIASPQVEALIQEILDTPEKELRELSLQDLHRRMSATIACHAAIKVNMSLDHAKMCWLLDQLAQTDCPMSCPHGRPIALKYGLKDILKAFHRI